MKMKRKKSLFTLLLFFILAITTTIISVGNIINTNALDEENLIDESEEVQIVVNKNWEITGGVNSILDSKLNYFWNNLSTNKIRIELYKNNELVYFNEIKEKSENYEINFGNWPKYSNGEKCVYTIKEIIPSKVASYGYFYAEGKYINTYVSTKDINMEETQNKYIFNICNSLYTSLSNTGGTEATRVYFDILNEWKGDGNNTALRPQNVRVKFNVKIGSSKLVDKEYILSSANTSYVDNVVVSYYKYQGKPVATIEESQVPGYKMSYKVEWSENTDRQKVIITNTYINKQNISGEKIWIGDNELNRPEKVKIWLLRDGQKYQSIEVSALNNWKYTFKDVPVLESGELNSGYEEGHVFEYSVEEEIVPGYKVSYDGYNIINTFIEEKEIEVIKIWDDDNNRNGKRPINITLQVKNGEKIVEESVVSGKDNWKYIFRLPKYGEDGNEIEYTVDEKEINKYYEKIIDGYTIVNKYIYNEDDIQKNDNIDLVDTSDIDIIIYICTFILAIVGIVTIILFIRKSKSNRKK